jgi:outer membrane protein assembly factor BamB
VDSATNLLEWIAPRTGPFDSTIIEYVDVTILSLTSCPASWRPGDHSLLRPITLGYPGSKHRFFHTGLIPGHTYCYAAFSAPNPNVTPSNTPGDEQRVDSRPFGAAPPPDTQWVYTTGAAALTPPAILPGGDYAGVSNDKFFHSMRASATGGEWPGGFVPTGFDQPVLGRTAIITPTTPVAGSRKIALAGTQEGRVFAIDVGSGRVLWASPDLAPIPGTGNVRPSPSAILTDFGGVADLVLVGLTISGTQGELVALNLANGTVAWRFTGGAAPFGPINGVPAVQYPDVVYFATRRGANPHNVFRLNVTGGGAVPQWSATVGDVDAPLSVRGGVVYAGDINGRVFGFDANAFGAGVPETWMRQTERGPLASGINDGAVRGFWSDAAANQLYVSTNTTVHALTPAGGYVWATDLGTPPSPPFQLGARVYVGTAGNRLIALNRADGSGLGAVTLGDPAWPEIVGRPSYDVTENLLVVGTEAGKFYALSPF